MNLQSLLTIIVLGITGGIVFWLAFVSFTSASRLTQAAIEKGEQDADIAEKLKDKNGNIVTERVTKGISAAMILSVVLDAVIAVFFVYSLFWQISNNHIGTVMVVGSDSMSYISGANKARGYLTDEMFNGGFSAGDFVKIKAKPGQDDLELYKVYVYRDENGKLVVHRLYLISETPDGIEYTFRGDANTASDTKAVVYNQIVGEYDGIAIKYLGNFILFAQSGFGMFFIIMLFGMLFMYEYFEKKHKKVLGTRARLISAYLQQTASARPPAPRGKPEPPNEPKKQEPPKQTPAGPEQPQDAADKPADGGPPPIRIDNGGGSGEDKN